MKKKLFFVLGLLMAVAMQVWSADAVYTLTAVKSTSNTNYTQNYNVTVNGITWTVPGNQSFDGYWRIGGKCPGGYSGCTGQDRELYSQNPITEDVSSIVFNHKGISRTDIEVQYISVTIASDANFTNVIETVKVTSLDVSYSTANTAGTFTVKPKSASGYWPAGSYYKITIRMNLIDSNAGFNFVSATFNGVDLQEAAISTAALNPATSESNVISLISDVYTTATPNANFNATWYAPPTLTKEVITDGDAANMVYHYKGLKTTGTLHWELNKTLNLSQMQYLHLDVYPVTTGSLNIALLSDGDELTSTTAAITLTQNTWNNIVLDLSTQFSAATLSAVNQIQITASGATMEFYLDNAYFSSVMPEQEVYVAPESVSLNATSLFMYEGQSFQLKATVYPENATDKNVTWSVINTGVVKVSNTGLVTVIGYNADNHIAYVRATTVNGKTKTCTIEIGEYIPELKVRVHPNNVENGVLELYVYDKANNKPLGVTPGTALEIDDEGWYSATMTNVKAPLTISKWTFTDNISTLTYSPQNVKIVENSFYALSVFHSSSNPSRDNIVLSKMDSVPSYTVRFENWNGAKLQESKWPEGSVPVLRRNNPTHTAGSEGGSYTFTGWLPEIDTIHSDITYVAQYEYNPPEGYYTVTFLDKTGQVIERVYIEEGQSATAPAAPVVENYIFKGWQAEGSTEILSAEEVNAAPVTAATNYKAVYKPDINLVTPITATEANTICSQLGAYTQSEDMYLIKGVVNTNITFGADNIVSFSMNWNSGSNIQVQNVSAPIVTKSDLQRGDTVLVYAYIYHGASNLIRNGSIEAILSSRHRYPTAPAHLMYDFTGNGVKEYIDERGTGYISSQDITYVLMERTGVNKYASKELLFVKYSDYDPKFLEDINGDGTPDISMWHYAYHNVVNTYVSGEEGYTETPNMAVITNFDINNDGRQDYIHLNNSQTLNIIGTIYYGDIYYQQPDGSFHPEAMQVMTWDEYAAQMTAEELDMMNNPQNYSLGDVSRYHYTPKMSETISGVCLARAPQRNRAPRAQGIENTISAPTKAIDLNRDGLMDLIDEKKGVIYTNMGNGKWVMTATNGIVLPADLNGDGVTDFIFPGNLLYVSVYDKTTNTFNTTTLYSNAAVDDVVYAQDFDRDGDIDLLATFSAVNNATNASYTCFFKNDGSGHFTRQAEQLYGTDKLLFCNLADIDGDGYYDLLALRDAGITKSNSNSYYTIPNTAEVIWLQGQANLQFAQAAQLFGINGTGSLQLNYGEPGINAEDLDNDGKTDIWLANIGARYSNSLKILSGISMDGAYTYPAAQANAAPSAPAAPTLQYNDSLLTITWGDGSDDHTMACDLTYALRIGTASGAMDILRPHANADGSRRNFLDGNMGRAHSYTINLNSYAPGTIYVAVQAIDAQHKGSAWSEEATIVHEKLPAEFTLNSNYLRLNDTLNIIFTALSDEYSQKWTFADGNSTVLSSSQIAVSFPTGGLKTITHKITAPNGKSASASQVVRVLPVYTVATDAQLVASELFYDATGDFNYDGRADVLGKNAVLVGTSTGNFTEQAQGLWNTNFLTSGYSASSMWYDYNRDGHADLLLHESHSGDDIYAYLAHAANANTLSDRVDDSNVAYIFGYAGDGTANYINLHEDFTHNGRYEVFKETNVSGYQLLVEQEDGSYRTLPTNNAMIDFIAYAELTGYKADFDRDGFTDLAYADNSGLKVAFAHGEGIFDIQTIPFAQAIQGDFSVEKRVDFNGDGYIDQLCVINHSDVLSVMWNNQNESFSAPEELPHEELLEAYMGFEAVGINRGQSYIIADIDANGYPDIAYQVQNQKQALSNNRYAYGLYVWLMGANGVENYGFLLDNLGTDQIGTLTAESHLAQLAADEWMLSIGNQEPGGGYSSCVKISRPADVAPAAPTGLVAATTEDGLLIQWNDAVDDHTPAALMRYNLSVRKQGSDTYLISPQNGGNNGTMPLSGYTYINATQFFIPAAYLSTGVYEIAVQALDMQQRFSDFTATINAAYTRENPIEAVTTACANTEVIVSYQGSDSENTPVWDFDGGTVTGGTGFGPYTVVWSTGGEKHITITVDDVIYSRTITIDNPEEMDVTVPAMLVMEEPAAAVVPSNVTHYEWYAQIGNDIRRQVTEEGMDVSTAGRYIMDKRLTADGLQITAHEDEGRTSLSEETVTLSLKVINANGCEAWFSTTVSFVNDAVLPVITLVTVDENAHNIINFSADQSFFTNVRILKETNVLNQFAEIAVVPTTQGAYIDTQSDASQKADRYRIQGVLEGGGYTAESAIHKTVHATINRGVQEGTYNLIWNQYEGADVVTYNILRGSSAATLTQIASVAASATSYTDQAPVDAEPYYVVEYVLSGTSAAAPAHRAPAAQNAALTGRSNIVEREGTQTPPEPVYYTIRFLNYDGAELQSSQVLEGDMPTYSGATPVRPEDEQYTYSFSGWSPAVVAAAADADYTAQFKSTQKGQGLDEVQSDDVQCTKVLINGQIFILRGEKIYTLTGQEVR